MLPQSDLCRDLGTRDVLLYLDAGGYRSRLSSPGEGAPPVKTGRSRTQELGGKEIRYLLSAENYF